MSPRSAGHVYVHLVGLENFQRLCMKILDLAEEARNSYPSDDLGDRIASTVIDFANGPK